MNQYRSERSRIETNNESCKTTSINIEFLGTISSIHDICSDIWQQIFQYFETIELFTTFAHINTTIDRVLFNENERFLLRGLTLDEHLKDLPAQIPLDRVISLTLHDTCYFKIIEQCSQLRSLKFMGLAEWIASLVRKIISQNTKLEQLTVIIPRIGSLPELLISILSISSLRRLEICADDLEDSVRIGTLSTVSSKIEHFVLRSSSTFNCNDLLCMLPHFTNIQLLDISLIVGNQNTIPSFISQNLRTLSLGLLEVSFNWIVQLVATIPCLVKLKLSGLVDSEGFVVNERWIHLFQVAPTLARIFVNISLEQDDESYYSEKLQTGLRAFNLQLICNDADNECFQYYGKVHRWWSLSGMIAKPSSYL